MSSTKSETKLETEMRATAVAAKTAGGKLARLGAEGRSKLLRALAAALREPGVREEVAAANAKDMERAKAENVATPLVKRLGLDAGKLDSVGDGLRPARAMPELVGRATLRRVLDHGLILKRVSAPLGVLGRGLRGAARTRWCRSPAWPGRAATPWRSRAGARRRRPTAPCPRWRTRCWPSTASTRAAMVLLEAAPRSTACSAWTIWSR